MAMMILLIIDDTVCARKQQGRQGAKKNRQYRSEVRSEVEKVRRRGEEAGRKRDFPERTARLRLFIPASQACETLIHVAGRKRLKKKSR